MTSVETRLRVRYAETDQMGVVYHANYIVWMEVGRVEFFRSTGLRYRDLEREGILLVVTEVGCRFKAPALYDEEVIVRTRVVDASPRMIHFEYELLVAEDGGRTLAHGFTKHVFCGRDRRPAKLPEKYRALFGIT